MEVKFGLAPKNDRFSLVSRLNSLNSSLGYFLVNVGSLSRSVVGFIWIWAGAVQSLLSPPIRIQTPVDGRTGKIPLYFNRAKISLLIIHLNVSGHSRDLLVILKDYKW